MKQIALIILAGLLYHPAAGRPSRLTKEQKRSFFASSRAITGHLGIGAIGGYATSSVGLEYERVVHSSGFLSVTLKGAGYLGGRLGLGSEIDEGEVRSQNSGLYAAPGVRFHPLRNWHRVDLGIGISMAAGYGKRRDNYSFGYYKGGRTVEENFFGAVLGEITGNFRKRHGGIIQSVFVMGGYIYSNAKARFYTAPNGRESHSENDPVYMQVGFRLGGRW